MWTCQHCNANVEVDVPVEVCPRCGVVLIEISGPEAPATAGPSDGPTDAESPTEFDWPDLPDPGPTVVECYIGVSPAEVTIVAERLEAAQIPVYLSTEDSDDGMIHRVRVPIQHLGRALGIIDSLHKRRTATP